MTSTEFRYDPEVTPLVNFARDASRILMRDVPFKDGQFNVQVYTPTECFTSGDAYTHILNILGSDLVLFKSSNVFVSNEFVFINRVGNVVVTFSFQTVNCALRMHGHTVHVPHIGECLEVLSFFDKVYCSDGVVNHLPREEFTNEWISTLVGLGDFLSLKKIWAVVTRGERHLSIVSKSYKIGDSVCLCITGPDGEREIFFNPVSGVARLYDRCPRTGTLKIVNHEHISATEITPPEKVPPKEDKWYANILNNLIECGVNKTPPEEVVSFAVMEMAKRTFVLHIAEENDMLSSYQSATKERKIILGLAYILQDSTSSPHSKLEKMMMLLLIVEMNSS